MYIQPPLRKHIFDKIFYSLEKNESMKVVIKHLAVSKRFHL